MEERKREREVDNDDDYVSRNEAIDRRGVVSCCANIMLIVCSHIVIMCQQNSRARVYRAVITGGVSRLRGERVKIALVGFGVGRVGTCWYLAVHSTTYSSMVLYTYEHSFEDRSKRCLAYNIAYLHRSPTASMRPFPAPC